MEKPSDETQLIFKRKGKGDTEYHLFNMFNNAQDIKFNRKTDLKKIKIKDSRFYIKRKDAFLLISFYFLFCCWS